MFDVGFSELALIGLIALLVLGPERLPPLIRSTGRWVGRAQRMVREMKTQFDKDGSVRELSRFEQSLRSGDLAQLTDEKLAPERSDANSEPRL
ncbi:MAG: Sec-independent protein translocase protein TatB [Gammaproteobacteria bacterium]